MRKTNKKNGKYLIAPIVSLFTLVTIGASIGFSSSGSLNALGDSVNKAKMKSAEEFNILKGSVTGVAANDEHTAAIHDGKLFMWGKNHQGQLGNNSTNNQNKPVYVDVDGDKNPDNDNVLDVSLGQYHSVARTSSGVYAWGWNFRGQLGLGNYDTRYTTPQKVTIPGTPTKIFAGFSHTTVLTSSGLYTWGYNANGQLGLGTSTEKYNTPQPLSIPGNITQISAGESHSAAITSSGLYTWGRNDYGQLGLGTSTAQYTSPQQVTIEGTPTQISMGQNHSSAITTSGLHTWGKNNDKQLGLGTSTLTYTTPQKVTIPGTPNQISMGSDHSFATTSSGLYAWGKNSNGQLGLGDSNSRITPEKSTLLPETPTKVSGGKYHSIFMTSSGAYTSGNNASGQLGLGNISTINAPKIVDHSSNTHKDLNVLDLLLTGVDVGNLKEKKASDIKTEEIISLIKFNSSKLFENYATDSNFEIVSRENFDSYKDGEEFFGKIELSFKIDKQFDWTGTPIEGDAKKLSITKFKLDPEAFTFSEIEPKENPTKDISIDDFVDITNLESSFNENNLIKYLDFKDFPEDRKILSINNIIKNHENGTISFEMLVKGYNKISEGGDFEKIDKEKTYEISLENFNVPSPTESKLFENYPKDLTVQELAEKLAPISSDTAKIKKELEKTVDFETYHKDSILQIIGVEQLNSTGILNFKINTSIWINDQNQKVKTNKEFSYSLKDLKIPAETKAVDVNNGYDTSLTAQEAAKLFVNGTKYELTDKFILDFADVETIPTGAQLTIKSSTPDYANGELEVVLTTNKYVDSSRYLNNSNKNLTYTLKGFNVLAETKAVDVNNGYDTSLTAQEAAKLFVNGT
ncbi:MAG: RCC1 domain-containing protein, partial [Mycoplasma sp.]